MEQKIKWAEGLLDKYPKVAAIMNSWVKDEMVRLQKSMISNLPQGVEVTLPEISESDVRAYAKISLAANPRSLYDFFGENNICVILENTTGIEKEYKGVIVNESLSTYLKNRVEAEFDIFTKAFALLESRL
jgi:hypothetical protein